jgi:hypothetical protein
LNPAALTYCWSFIHEEEQVRSGEGPTDCTYLRGGTCYGGAVTYLGAEEFCKKHVAALAKVQGPDPHTVVAELFEHCDELWRDMSLQLLEERDAVLATHEALPLRCPTCNGKGTVHR